MKINRISTYILVCLLTSRIRNLLIPVKGDVEGAEGSVIAPTADGSANQPVDPATQLKLFKDDSNNNKVPIEAKDFFQDTYRGHLTYVLRKNVKCTLVKFGDKDVWKKGDEQVEEPKSVTYDPYMMELAVRDAKYSVHFGMDSQTSDWKHVVTYERGKRLVATKREKTVTFMRPSRPRSSYSLPVLFSLGLSLYDPVLKSASTTPPKQAEPSQEPVKSPEKEADQASTVPLGTSEAVPESGSGSALRGTTGTAEGSGEAQEPPKGISTDGDSTAESGQGATKEENEEDSDQGKEVSAVPDGTSGSASADAGWTAGGSASSAGDASADGSAKSPAEGTSSGDASADADGTSSGVASSDADAAPTSGQAAESGSSGEGGSSGGTDASSGWTAGEGADGTSGSPPAVPAVPSGGSDADDTSQPSSGESTYGGTGTRDQDGSAGGSTEAGGSTTTPPASSGGDGTSGTPGQGASTTPPTAASTDTSTKTGVELSIKKTSGTNEFDYKKEGNAVTYTAKDSFGFSSVKTKIGGSCGSGGTDLTIWEAENASEYASKVVLDGKGKKKKEVTIHQPNNTKKVFKRDDKSKPWNEISHQSNQTNGQPASGTPASGTTPADASGTKEGDGTTPADGSGTKEGGDGNESSSEGQDESGTTTAEGTGTGEDANASGGSEDASGTKEADGTKPEDENESGEAEDGTGTKEGDGTGTGGSGADGTPAGS